MKKKREEFMDRISDLPDPIVHYIMSFLTTVDLTKFSILSKRFFLLWSSFPVIDFDVTTFNRSSLGMFAPITEEFLDHIHNSIRLRKIDTVISEFKVKVYLKGVSADHRLDSAISFALENGVKLLDLNLGLAKYQLPVFFASRSINVLRLTGLKLDVSNLILACPSLKTLSLTSCIIIRDINFSSQTLQEIDLHSCFVKFIKITAPKLQSFSFDSGMKDAKPCRIDLLECENIANLSLNNVTGHDWVEELTSKLGKLETFVLNGCQDIASISVWNNRLERVEISNCPLLSSIKFIAPSLESFRYKGTDRHRASDISFIASNSIRDLHIENASITDEWLDAQLIRLCYLESLRLKACNSLKKILIIHEKLQILELLNCLHLEEAEVDTPQLVSFVHRGNMVKFGKMVTRSICTATLFICPWVAYNYESFYRWNNLLSYFGHCKDLKLVCNYEKELIVPGDMREMFVPPLYDLQSLEVHIKSLKRIGTDLVESLLWLSPLPNTIRIFSDSRSQLQMIIKFAYDETIKEEEEDKLNPFCCTSKPIKCWRHKLKRLDIQTKDVSPKYGSVALEKYFLKNSMILETLSFTIGFD